MTFLNESGRTKVLRTVLYGDQEFSKFELEIVHTPIFQRLYNLKQLGFADRVFPDAIHSRFNHVLGVCEVISQMSRHLLAWLDRNDDRSFTFADGPATENTLQSDELLDCFKERLASLRLMGLLHDLTHAAFGHTLEDEVRVFQEKHDEPDRQVRFFDGLVAQLVYIWRFDGGATDANPEALKQLTRLEFNQATILTWAEDVWEQLPTEQQRRLAVDLAALEYALRLLSYLDFAHEHAHVLPEEPPLLVGAIIDKLRIKDSRLDLVFHRDLFMIDIVGNTMCADLLDYARRDPENAGLQVSFDTRFLRYLSLVTVGGDRDTKSLSPTGRKCVRIAIQFFKEKMRHDVLSEMSMVLKARYLITERVLFHPTKCAAGALLGTAAQLLGLQRTPKWMQVLGDQQFLAQLDSLADTLLRLSADTRSPDERNNALQGLQTVDPDAFELVRDTVQQITGRSLPELFNGDDAQWKDVNQRAKAASIALWRLASRRLPKLAFRLRPGAHQSGGKDLSDVATAYTDPNTRYALERRLETVVSLPMGSVTIHCPGRRTSMKLAGVLVVGNDPAKVRRLRDVTEIVKEELEPYQDEIQSVERMYASIWQFQIFLDDAHFDKQPVLEWAILRELKGFNNDALLIEELKRERSCRAPTAYSMLMDTCVDDVAPGLLPTVVARLGQQPRFRGVGTDLEKYVRAVIRAVQDEENGGPEQQQLPLGP